MYKQLAALVIVALISTSVPTYAQNKSEIKLKRQIVTYGTNQNVKVTLTTNETLEGRITDIRNDAFTLQGVDSTGRVTSREIAYPELSKVAKLGGPKAAGALKRGMLYGAGFYAGMVLVGLVVLGIAAAAAR